MEPSSANTVGKEDSHPQLTALNKLCQLKGISLNSHSLMHFLNHSQKTASHQSIKLCRYQLSLDQLKNLHLPVYLKLQNNSACILTKINRDHTAHVIAPELEQDSIRVSLTNLADEFSGEVITIEQQQRRVVEPLGASALLLSVPTFFLSQVLLTTFIFVLCLSLPLLLGLATLPVASVNANFSLLSLGIIGILGLLALLLLQNFRRQLGRQQAQRFYDHLKQQFSLLLSALHLGQYHQQQQELNQVFSNLSGDSICLAASPARIMHILFSFIALAFASLFLGWLTLLPLGALLINGVIAIYYSKQQDQLSIEDKSALDIESYKLSGAESLLMKAVAGFTPRKLPSQAHRQPFLLLCNGIIIIAVITFSIHSLALQQIGLSGFLSGILLCVFSLITAYPFPRWLQQSYRCQQDLMKINHWQQKFIEQQRTVSKNAIQGKIALEEICVSYPNTQQNLFSNISISIEPGERIAIIGSIGAGKSSILKLIAGLLQPSKGCVKLDNLAVENYDPLCLSPHVSYVGQRPNFIPGTLRDNIAAKCPWVSDDEILACLFQLGMDQQLLKHPQGLNRVISARGDELSAGQRQMIAIARTILLKPSILLLDEPTASLDNHAEKQMIKLVENYDPQATLLVVTHKMAFLNLVDRIIVVQEGKIIADGVKEQVLKLLSEIQKSAKKAS